MRALPHGACAARLHCGELLQLVSQAPLEFFFEFIGHMPLDHPYPHASAVYSSSVTG
jgi:hypothetical protein